MGQYELEGFELSRCSKEFQKLLKEFLKKVIKLHSITTYIINYYEEKIKVIEGKEVEELPEDLKEVVLGGLKQNGEYSKNAYALFIKDFIGASIKDPKLYAVARREGIRSGVKVVIEDTLFMEFVKLLKETSKLIIKNVKNKVKELRNEITDEEIVKKGGSKIEDLVTELIKVAFSLSVGVDNFMGCVWGLKKITLEYLEKVYEIPKSDINKDKMLRILGFRNLNINGYEIWGFPDYCLKAIEYYNGYWIVIPKVYVEGRPVFDKFLMRDCKRCYDELNKITRPTRREGTLGGIICFLNEIIWEYISADYERLRKWYENIINLKEEYMRKAHNFLNKIGWKEPQYLKQHLPYIHTIYGAILQYNKEQILTRYIVRTYKKNLPADSTGELDEPIPLRTLFNDLMPAIFLGVVDVAFISNVKNGIVIFKR